MSITAKEGISVARKDIRESVTRKGGINTTKTLLFKHQANGGDLIIDTTGLTTPTSSAANGYTPPSLSEIAGLNLLMLKKSIKIYSSRGAWLQLYDDFIVTGANTIQFVGSLEALGGAEQDEIFTVYASPVDATSFILTDSKKQYQEYLLPSGQTLLNLGREFEVNKFPTSQIGALRVFRKGIGPQLRNVGNAAADPLADGNFQEIDAGNGLGVSIQFNIADSEDNVVVVEFGLEYAGDLSIYGDIQALYGAILKLADDVKELGPYEISRYITANPSDVERRAFGDQVLDLLTRVGILESPPDVELYLESGNGHGAVANKIRRFSTAQKDTLGGYATYVDDANNGASITINIAGVYEVTYIDSQTADSSAVGISLNASSLTTSIATLTFAQGRRSVAQSAAGPRPNGVTTSLRCVPGDVIRPHTDGTPNSVAGINDYFKLTRIGP